MLIFVFGFIVSKGRGRYMFRVKHRILFSVTDPENEETSVILENGNYNKTAPNPRRIKSSARRL
jgi:hypothetical protein